MKFRLALLAAGSALLLTGCLSSSGPLWLQAGEVDMKQYRNERVILLPVEANPVIDISEDNLRLVQSKVKVNLDSAFKLKRVDSLSMIDLPHAYPYHLKEISEIAQIYNARAVAAVSIFSVARHEGGENSRMGLRITFADALDLKQSWTMTREYRSGSGFDFGSTRLGNTLESDFETIVAELNKGGGVLGLLNLTKKRDPRAPRVVISFPEDGLPASGAANAASEQQRVRHTEVSRYPVRLWAEDASGLASTIIRNNRGGAPQEVTHTPDSFEATDAALFVNEIVPVDVEPGVNEVEFRTTNRAGKTSVNTVTIIRKQTQTVYGLAVGIDNYQQFGANAPAAAVQGTLSKAAERTSTLRYLANQDATQTAIENELYDISDNAWHNESGLGLFYFAGKVEARKDGAYLVAYDSTQKNVEVTAVRVANLPDILPPNSAVFLDLCERNPVVQQTLIKQLPNATISFNSCDQSTKSLATQIDEARTTQPDASLRSALEQVIKDNKR